MNSITSTCMAKYRERPSRKAKPPQQVDHLHGKHKLVSSVPLDLLTDIILLAIASSDNPADMMTKCVPKDAFFRHRAVLLGTAPPPEPTQATPDAK